jgi:hypothetical protein
VVQLVIAAIATWAVVDRDRVAAGQGGRDRVAGAAVGVRGVDAGRRVRGVLRARGGRVGGGEGLGARLVDAGASTAAVAAGGTPGLRSCSTGVVDA